MATGFDAPARRAGPTVGPAIKVVVGIALVPSDAGIRWDATLLTKAAERIVAAEIRVADAHSALGELVCCCPRAAAGHVLAATAGARTITIFAATFDAASPASVTNLAQVALKVRRAAPSGHALPAAGVAIGGGVNAVLVGHATGAILAKANRIAVLRTAARLIRSAVTNARLTFAAKGACWRPTIRIFNAILAAQFAALARRETKQQHQYSLERQISAHGDRQPVAAFRPNTTHELGEWWPCFAKC